MKCICCGATVGVRWRCHACDYVQDAIYDHPETRHYLNMSDYNLAILFFPHLMMSEGASKCIEYASEIRGKLLSYSGRRELQNLTAGRSDGWLFMASL